MHPSWGSYPDTILHFPGSSLRIDLRRPVGPGDRRGLAGLGLDRPFGVVTASNPLGIPLEKSVNQRLDRVLAGVVKTWYPEGVPAHGESPDGEHVECGFALPGTPEEARNLAARFFQKALFWYDGDRFFIMPVLAVAPPLALPPAAS